MLRFLVEKLLISKQFGHLPFVGALTAAILGAVTGIAHYFGEDDPCGITFDIECISDLLNETINNP